MGHVLKSFQKRPVSFLFWGEMIKYFKKRNPDEFEFNPNEDESYLNIPVTILDIQKENNETFLILKKKLKQKAGSALSDDNFNEITNRLIDLYPYLTTGLFNTFYDLKMGFKYIKDDLRQNKPIYYDEKTQRLFLALEDYGYFPSADYRTVADQINCDDCQLLRQAYNDLKMSFEGPVTNEALKKIAKSSEKDNTYLLGKLYEMYNDIFSVSPRLHSNEYNENFAGQSLVFFESILHALNRDIQLSTVCNFLKDKNKKQLN